MAQRRGYDLEREGALYANHVTNDAWSFYLAGLERHSPVQEAGPWHAGRGPKGEFYLQSGDFDHDASLRLGGDFADDATRQAYVEQLAKWLNRGSSSTVMPDGWMPGQPEHAARIALSEVLQLLEARVATDPQHAKELAQTTRMHLGQAFGARHPGEVEDESLEVVVARARQLLEAIVPRP